MPATPAFYSSNEINKPVNDRVHHNNSTCPPGRDIKAAGKNLPGMGGYPLCYDCQQRNRNGQ